MKMKKIGLFYKIFVENPMKMKEIGSANAHTNIPYTFIGIIEVQ